MTYYDIPAGAEPLWSEVHRGELFGSRNRGAEVKEIREAATCAPDLELDPPDASRSCQDTSKRYQKDIKTISDQFEQLNRSLFVYQSISVA